MVELIIVILILAFSVLAFNIQAESKVRARRTAVRKEQYEQSFATSEADKRTIELIGEEAYLEMTKRIDEILRNHSHQAAVTVNLTCGPDTRSGASELHRLLPGTRLELLLCSEQGIEWIDVYAEGNRIGRLALLETYTLKEIMKDNHMRAAYVAEQNCYGIEDSHMISIIVFYEPKIEGECRVGEFLRQMTSARKEGMEESASRDICQN